MKKRLALGVALLLVLGGSALADKLSSSDWKALVKEADAALAKKDLEAIRGVLDRATSDQSARAFSLIEQVAIRWDSDAVLPACTKALRALEGKPLRKLVRADASSNKQLRVKLAAVSALDARDREDATVLVRLVSDPNEDVAIPAVRALGEARVESAIDPLVAAMEKLDAARGPVWEELRYALADLLGKKLASGAEYRSRWAALKAKGGTKAIGGPDDPPPPKPDAKGARTVELFGQEVTCTRVVFILDVSGSMTEIDDPDLALPPETKGKTPGKNEADPRSRIERAKRELVKVLKGLPKAAKVNLIAFSTAVRLWKGGYPPTLHQLDDATREDAIKFVDTFSAEGTTATDDALARAFDVLGARCFYLLSDGEPTKDGTTRIPTETILKLIAERNATRHVRIHTLGFKGADVDFMKAVAAATGGEYSDIK